MAQEIGNSNLLEVWATSGQVVEPDISKIEEGWQLGEQPPHEFMNWLQNTFGAKLNHVLSNGTPQWNSGTSYGAGSTVQRTGNVWIAMQPNSNSEPASGNTNWSRLLKLADATTEATADKVALRDENGTFKVGEPVDPEHPVRKQEFDAQAADLQWLGTAVAETKTLMSDNSALYPPTDSSLFRYILLSEGLDGAGQYNDGILINETITGSGVERQVTAEISLPASPLHGQVIHLINSERSHLRPGETAGAFEQDQMQRITGQFGARRTADNNPFRSSSADFDGAFSDDTEAGSSAFGIETGTVARSGDLIKIDSANSPDARASATTDGETRVKSVSAIYFLRVA